MKNLKLISAAFAFVVALASCSSPEKMAEAYDSVAVSCTPEVLEVVAGSIDAQVAVTFPAKYFNTKGILEITPVIVYEGGEQAMQPFVYQGEKVADNNKVVKNGESMTVTEKVHFTYAKGMEKSTLELRAKVRIGDKVADAPSKKIADGAVTTYMLVNSKGTVCYKKDNYQEVIPSTIESQILYGISSSAVAGKQLSSASMKDYKAAVAEAVANERKTVVSTDIVAYASPDGTEAFNSSLSANRGKSAEKAYGKVVKGTKVDAPVNVKSVGEDWEGFQELVSASNIEDKELILRVLSMYSDPAVRESEIKNLSAVYKTLAKEVLPALRRARFIANVEFTNYTDEELSTLIAENIDVLDEEALLHAAAIAKDNAVKETVYKKAVEKFASERAQYNLAVLYFNMGKDAEAAAALAKCSVKDGEWYNASAALALRAGKVDEASALLEKAGKCCAANENRAVVAILKGDYATAAAIYKDQKPCEGCGAKGCCGNKALAFILAGDYAAAAAAIDCDCPKSNYLKAVIAARQGKSADAKAALEKATKNAALAERAAKDVEFARL